MRIHESGENYLETILQLKKRNEMVRSIDIARELSFSKPSVSRAIAIFKEEGLVNVEENGNITLTEKGYIRAQAVLERHITITDYLQKILGVSPENAEKDACRIEHVISEETFSKIKKQLGE